MDTNMNTNKRSNPPDGHRGTNQICSLLSRIRCRQRAKHTCLDKTFIQTNSPSLFLMELPKNGLSIRVKLNRHLKSIIYYSEQTIKQLN